LVELDSLPEFAARGGFAWTAFGGPERVSQLGALLEELRLAGTECLVCSRGLVGPVRRCLDKVGLLGHFTQVFANIGGASSSASVDATDFDRRVAAEPTWLPEVEAQHLGSPADGAWGSKAQLMSRLLRERGLQGGEAVLIDDTASEVESARAICRTIQVQPPQGMGPRESPQGMGPREFELLRRLLAGSPCSGPGPRPGPLAGEATARPLGDPSSGESCDSSGRPFSTRLPLPPPPLAGPDRRALCRGEEGPSEAVERRRTPRPQ